MKPHYPVLICGAGPTGLMMAAQLLRFGIDFLIVDSKNGPTTESRAVVVQARSLEIYEQMALAEDVLRDGTTASGLCFWRDGKQISEVHLTDFGKDITPFSFVFMYEQSKNETLLYKHLQKHNRGVAWLTQLLSYEETGTGFTVQLRQEEENITVTADYLIACDGAKSKLREISGMEFSGGTYQQVFYVADTHIHAPVCDSKLNFFVNKNTFHLLFPMQGSYRYRAIGILPPEYYHQENITFKEVSEAIERDAGMSLRFYDTQWYSTYRLHHKKVKSFSKGNLFFCGDAAHVHSPAGGQGMNTGLQDAYNLAWKLALVINKEVKKTLLQTYHEERNPVAERLLQTTDRMFGMMAKDDWIDSVLRLYIFPNILPGIMRMQWIRRKAFEAVSQTLIEYHHSSLSAGKGGSIKAGGRLPYLRLFMKGKETSLYVWLREMANRPLSLLLYRISLNEAVNSELIQSLSIEVNDANDKAITKAGFSSSFVLLLRPDNYIGYVSEKYDVNELKNYLEQHLQVT